MIRRRERVQKDQLRTKRVDGYLHRIVTIKDSSGEESVILLPFGVEFRPRDFLQIIVGASILAAPVAFTEEVWILAETLSFTRIMLISLLSLFFISQYVYYNFYRFHLKEHFFKYLFRVLSIYIGSFLVCTLVLALLGKTGDFWDIGFKRVVLVSFPASMSAAISDTIK